MSEISPVLDEFFPILIENFIRFETAALCVRNRDDGAATPSVAKFKIAPEYYNQMITQEITAPLIGLTLPYDEGTSILTVEPTPYFMELYENKIMSDVAIKQSEESKGRYSKFIELVA